MAELVDARVSEARGREVVMVRFHSSAPKSVGSRESRVESLEDRLPIFLFLLCVRLVFAGNFPEMRNEFISALKTHQTAFGLDLPDEAVERLADYYELIQEHNEFLHLVGPCSPEEFATRHVLESLTLLEHLPNAIWFADVGTGGGLPSIPCLLVREDLKAVLIESKEKKSKFLTLAVEKLRLKYRTRLSPTQFAETNLGHCEAVTCRALDKFTERLPRLITWSGKSKMLFFGGENLKKALEKEDVLFKQRLMPLSEQRFLFVLKKFVAS